MSESKMTSEQKDQLKGLLVEILPEKDKELYNAMKEKVSILTDQMRQVYDGELMMPARFIISLALGDKMDELKKEWEAENEDK